MRVVAGIAGGLPLRSPPGGARPTMDRVRGAIFSSLGGLVSEARILDLFCGSGALGIEALSRGAAACIFVDHHRGSCDTTRNNLSSCKLQGSVQCMDVSRFLATFCDPQSFDLIFADPPYGRPGEKEDLAASLLNDAALTSTLKDTGLLVLECGRRSRPPLPDTWQLIREKTYGETAVLFLGKS